MRKLTEVRREAIIAAAAQEFGECGYERASVSAIAARIASSKATIYRYFPSKEELFAEVTSRTIDQVMAAADAELVGSDLSQGLRRYGQRYLTFRQSPEATNLIRLMFGESARSEIGRLMWKGLKLHGVEILAGILAKEMETGHLRPADPSVAAFHLFALLDAELTDAVVLRARDPASAEEIKDVVNRAVDAFLGAYGPRPAR